MRMTIKQAAAAFAVREGHKEDWSQLDGSVQEDCIGTVLLVADVIGYKFDSEPEPPNSEAVKKTAAFIAAIYYSAVHDEHDNRTMDQRTIGKGIDALLKRGGPFEEYRENFRELVLQYAHTIRDWFLAEQPNPFSEVEQLKGEIERLKNKLSGAEIEELENAYGSAVQEIEQLKARLKTVEADRDQACMKVGDLRREIEQLKAELDVVKRRDTRAELVELEAKCETGQKALAVLHTLHLWAKNKDKNFCRPLTLEREDIEKLAREHGLNPADLTGGGEER